jgi:predicted dehydrogenase
VIRIAVAGAGEWGRNHVRVLASLRGARLDWVAEPDDERREAATSLAPQARFVADVAEALADPRLDALVIASPSPTHAPIARAALAAGKHVLVEKPLAPRVEDAADLVARARRARRLLVTGHLLLYHPAVARLKRLLVAGRLGRLHYLYGQRTNLGRIRTDEGALTSLAPHDVSVMAHLLDAWPHAVSANGAAYVQPHHEDVVFLVMHFPGGVLGHVHLSWLDPHKVRRLSLVGDRRMAVFDDMEPFETKLRLHDTRALPGAPDAPPGSGPGWLDVRSGRTQVVAMPAREPLAEELRAFLACIRDGTEPRTPGEDGVRAARVLEAAQASLASGGATVPLRIGGGRRRPRAP